MISLPIDRSIPEILARLREARSLVLVAEPGAGKTTRVPPAVLGAGLLAKAHPNLVMLQPRRVAARASAQRIAEENAWEMGREVGYHIRFEKRIGPHTRLRVLTEGILTRQLLDDPFLEGVGAVVLDEFHERSLHTDLTLAFLREVRQTVRDDLMLIVMSATLEAEPVARFLGNCPIIRVEGRTFPVEVCHVGGPFGVHAKHLPDRVAAAVGDAVSGNGAGDAGDVLAFLPGVEEIRRTMARLEPLAMREDLLVLPLHGSLGAEDQMAALRPSVRRKIICATNIAETSLTIDGVRTVIDSGYARVAGYDPRRGLDRLELKRISRASAKQRAGRAGRTALGRCIRLWSEREDRSLAEHELPEVMRVDLAGTVLLLHAWGKPDPRAFGWYEPPPEPILVAAERLLAMLGALDADANGQITPIGRQLMTLPIHPRLARLMVDAASCGLVREGAALAALVSEKDIVRISPSETGHARVPTNSGRSDVLMRLDLLSQAERERFGASLRDRGIDPAAARQVARTRDELVRLARRLGAGAKAISIAQITTDDALLKLILTAYPDRVARRRGTDPASAVMVGGGGLRLAPESVLRQAEFFVAVDARQDERSLTRQAIVRVASEVRAEWLEELFPQQIRRDRSVIFDAQRQRVVGRNAVMYRDLVLREDREAQVDPIAASQALAQALRPAARDIFNADESAKAWLDRLAILKRAMPEHAWPKLEDPELGDLLAEVTPGKRSVEEVRNTSLAPLLQGCLPYPLDRLFEQNAPEFVEVPSGSRIRLDYGAGLRPVLAVRLQEVFGWTDTPRIAGGRVPILLHLLGPNYRPVQITDDLRSFWSTTYFQVRKDLRVKYPKHSWPEDPLTAKPVAKGRSSQRRQGGSEGRS